MSLAVSFVFALIGVGVAQVTSTQVACQCDIPTNRRILQDFYTATEGPSEWSIAWNFNSQSLCELYGVNCTELNVTSLSIGPIGVAGTLPASLSSLDRLQTLVISYNSGLHGTIPPSYGNLVSLTTLSIVGCQLSGTIPASLNNLVNLRSLSLQSNSLTGSLSAVSNMRSLQSIDLSGNQLTGPIPSALSTTLSNINLAFNYDLQLNSDTVPLSFGSLRQLRTLTLSSTKFTDGTFPPALCSLVNLTSLDVSSSQLRGSIPQCLSSFANIESLNIGSNAFNATIPSFVYTLTRLTTLQCPACLLRGPIDGSIGLLTNLAILDLSHGILSGGIPDTIGQLTSLTYLSLSTNSLTGTLPSAIANCSQLRHLEVQGNLLHGTVPKELGSLQYLSTSILSNNMLIGTIPPIVNMTSLQILNLGHNSLTGTLPSALPPKIWYLSLSGNNISGGLPQAWYKSSLTNLDVSNNSLSGILPPVWGLKTDWQRIVLGNNRIMGMLPASWARMVGLAQLQLQSNSFSGPFPPRWGVDMRAASLSLGGNPRLCGGVPSSWTNRTNPIPSDAGSISNAACNATRFITTPPPRLSRRVTLQYCSIACDRAAPGYFPATPQTDEEIVAMTAVARNAYLTARKNASQAAGYFLLGGGMIASDPTTLRWLSGALGDTDDGEGTIFYVEDVTLPSGLCVAPCALAKDFSVLKKDTLGQLLVLDIFSAHWVMMDASAFPGVIGCMCQEETYGRRSFPHIFTLSATSSRTHLKVHHSAATQPTPSLSMGLVTSSRLSTIPITSSLTLASYVTEIEISSTVTLVTAISSFVTAAASAVGSSATGLSMLQTVTQMNQFKGRCGMSVAASSSSPLMSDVVDNPLQIRWKVFGGDLKYATGSVLSNVVMGIVLLCCRWVIEHLTQPQRRHLLTVGRRLPGSTLAPVAAVLQPLVAASVVHVGTGAGGAVVFGVVTVCVLMAYVGWLVRTVALNRDMPLVCAEVNDDAPRRQFLQRICFTSCEWTTAPCDGEEHEAAAEYLERYGDVVAPYRGGRHWFFAIELATSWFVATVSGVSMALPHTAACSNGVPTLLTSLQLVGSVALGVLCVVLKPFDVPLEGLLFVMQLLLTSGALVIVLASDQSSAPANGLMLAQSLVTFVVVIALTVIALRRTPKASRKALGACLALDNLLYGFLPNGNPNENLAAVIRLICTPVSTQDLLKL